RLQQIYKRGTGRVAGLYIERREMQHAVEPAALALRRNGGTHGIEIRDGERRDVEPLLAQSRDYVGRCRTITERHPPRSGRYALDGLARQDDALLGEHTAVCGGHVRECHG